MEIYLRCFVEVDSQAIAEQIKGELEHLLIFLEPALESRTKKYWKIPEYYEVYLSFDQSGQHDYDKALSILGTGWEKVGDKDAIWNPSEDGKFFDDRVKWAQLEMIE